MAQVWDHVTGQWRVVRDLFVGASPAGAVHRVIEQVSVDGTVPPYTTPGDPRPGYDVSALDSAGRDLMTISYFVDDLGRAVGGWDHPLAERLRPAGFVVPVTSALVLPGVNTGGTTGLATIGANAAFNFTGSTFVAIDVTLPDWTPAAQATLLSKWTVLFNLKGWKLDLATTGRLVLNYSPDGTTDRTFTSSVNPTVSDGQRLAVGAEIVPNDGGGNRTVTFYTAPSMFPFSAPTSWTQLGAVQSQVGAEAIFAANVGPVIGGHFVLNVSSIWAGRVHAAEIRSGSRTGTVVFRADFTHSEPGTTQLNDETGKAIVVNPTAQLVAA